MRNILSLLIIILVLACAGREDKMLTPATVIESKIESTILEEHYVDSLLIGKKGGYKLDFRKYRDDSVYVNINIYRKNGAEWRHVQNFNFLKDGILSADVEIKDFNNDGFIDFTFKSAIAARGANEIRKLFIFDRAGEKFVYIKNSEDYPNIRYNKDLDCIDGFRVYGGCETVFARIDADSLKEFASVELFDERLIVTTTDESCKRREIRNEKAEESYKRFKTYSPLAELDEK